MDIEYEATFTNVDKKEAVEKLQKAGAKLQKREFLQKRVVFLLPKGHEINGAWLRVRDEKDKVTMSLKVIDGTSIENQKELCIAVDDFKKAVRLLESIGCEKKAYQESRRELWKLGNVEITIDEWPFLEPFVEVEGPSENSVKDVCKMLGFDYQDALFCSVDTLYSKKYGISEDRVNNQTPRIVFGEKNPFLR